MLSLSPTLTGVGSLCWTHPEEMRGVELPLPPDGWGHSLVFVVSVNCKVFQYWGTDVSPNLAFQWWSMPAYTAHCSHFHEAQKEQMCKLIQSTYIMQSSVYRIKSRLISPTNSPVHRIGLPHKDIVKRLPKKHTDNVCRYEECCCKSQQCPNPLPRLTGTGDALIKVPWLRNSPRGWWVEECRWREWEMGGCFDLVLLCILPKLSCTLLHTQTSEEIHCRAGRLWMSKIPFLLWSFLICPWFPPTPFQWMQWTLNMSG